MADHALLVSFADAISDAASTAVLALDAALAQAPPAGMAESVPALVSLLIDFDPAANDHAGIQAHVQRLLRDLAAVDLAGELHEVEVCYDDDLAPDLPAVAAATGLGAAEVIAAHLEGDYRVRMYGFAPGYAYLSGVPGAIQVPRKPAALRDIAAGSVLIAGPQCLVTTLKMPTGWSIIGRSPTRILSRSGDRAFLFGVGDRVRFKRIDRSQYDARRPGDADG